MSLNKELILVVALCGLPFLLFGAAELALAWKRRKWDAVARRSKARLAGGPSEARRR